MKNIQKAERGITLIALVITIIVMLILVSVTVTLAINGGLFDYAKTAAEGTNQAAEEEKALSSGTVLIRNGAVNEEVDIGTFYNE